MENGNYSTEIEAFIHEYKAGLADLKEKLPEVVDQYHAFTGACFKKGKLDQKTKHLIALGIGLATQDEYCIMYHTQEALQKGASDAEILEALGVSAALTGGIAMSHGATLVQACLEELPHRKH
ncbi:carboxymuconolactone decarboxylase family protein [Caldalkalibacillus uzonensis]|nr:carboxymuconolactone decarboxylase family protein [Caldalkalibacillus uzonensis]